MFDAKAYISTTRNENFRRHELDADTPVTFSVSGNADTVTEYCIEIQHRSRLYIFLYHLHN